MGQPPDSILNETDPGDDVQRRFGFQATKAAMLSLSLLDNETEVEDVYCEHHEDILVKKCGNRFIGYQVKTKLDEAGPHKSTDREIIRSIERFVELERTFGQHFDRYAIGTNAGFWDEDATVSSLPHILSLVQNARGGEYPRKVIHFLKKVFAEPEKPRKKKTPAPGGNGTAGTTDPQADYERQRKAWEANIELGKAVLRKLTLETLPSLRDMRSALITMLPKFAEIGDRLYSELGALADGLIAEMLKAARLVTDSARDRYLAVFDNPNAMNTCEIIKCKRITKERLLTLLSAVPPVQPTLCTNEPISVSDLPKGMGTLETKMAVGGISIENVSLAKDLKASTELLLTRWLHRDGKKATDGRYQHLRTLVRSECQEALDRTRTEDRTFGVQMLHDVRQRLRSRHTQQNSSLFGCSYEHLMGMAAILTEDCTLRWSQPFVIPQKDDAA